MPALHNLYAEFLERQSELAVRRKVAFTLLVLAVMMSTILAIVLAISSLREQAPSAVGFQVVSQPVVKETVVKESRILRRGTAIDGMVDPTAFITPLVWKHGDLPGLDGKVISRTSASAWEDTLRDNTNITFENFADDQKVVAKLPDTFECNLDRKSGDLTPLSMILLVYREPPMGAHQTYVLFPDHVETLPNQVKARFTIAEQIFADDEIAEARTNPRNLYFQTIVCYGAGASSAANVRLEFAKP